VVGTSNVAQRKLFGDETVAYHEGIPGHHMQVSIQQQLTGLPEFRLYLINSAYAEGWGLYAEALGKEIGFFQDPGSDYGRLSLELLRAVRLVVDTGIHSQGWMREEALAYSTQTASPTRLTGTLHGRHRPSATNSANSKFLSCVTAPSNSLAPLQSQGLS
jgi:uncharacterized protein (DUF885 family)